jgi:cholesterol 7-dehydrogenase
MPIHPPPPEGWFAVCASRKVKRSQVQSVRYFDTELVVFRGDDGVVRVSEATCPHLGAHLGAGRVNGCQLRCPMHGFEFAPSGQCISAPYGMAPKKLSIRMYPAVERVGFVFIWWSKHGRAPTFELPDIDLRGYSGLSVLNAEFTGHPQETTENGVDVGHFTEVHGYAKAKTLVPPAADGAVMRSGFAVYRGRLRLEFKVSMHGLGFSVTEAGFPSLGVKTRIFSFVTPLGLDRVHARFCSASAAPFPFTALAGWVAHRSYVHDVQQDIRIWNTKRHIDPPRLNAAEAPIAAFRKWAKQFYTDAN